MSDNQSHNPKEEKGVTQPTFNTGNASNPAPHDESLTPAEGAQLLNEKAEKYLREVASIEDVPDAQDQQDMDDTLKKENS